MKSKEELNALKEEIKTLSEKLAELSEEELAEVTGGYHVPLHIENNLDARGLESTGREANCWWLRSPHD